MKDKKNINQIESSGINNISIVIIVSNAEKTLKKCLDSLVAFNEVILYLNNTTDNSKNIASEYENVVIHEGEFKGYSETKNLAASFASNDWILSIDSDEFLDNALIKQLNQNKTHSTNTIYKIKFYTYYMGKVMRGGYDRPTWKKRLYNRTSTKWTGKIHEGLDTTNIKVVKLNGGGLFHCDPLPNNNDPIENDKNLIKYTNKRLDYVRMQKSNSKNTKPNIMHFISAIMSFIHYYIFKFGFLDGWVGIVSSYRYCKIKYQIFTENLD